MKVNLFGLIAVLGFAGNAMAASMYSTIDMRNADGNTIRIDRGYSSSDRSYVRHASNNCGSCNRGYQSNDYGTYSNYQTQSSRVSQQYGSMKRKFFIANPFYQPLKGTFGSVTTGEYVEGKYNFSNATGYVGRELDEWAIKEDLSYGLTDGITLQAMAKYNSNTLTWKDNAFAGGGKDENTSRGLNIYGLGVQGRIVDTPEWISILSGYYEHQKHGIDYWIADLKAGYKISRTTIYGLGRVWLLNMEGDMYGDYMDDAAQWAMVVYSDAGKDIVMGELGMGVWSVLSEDWTMNIEALYGLYDWHNQLSIKGAIGWQPSDYFALNLYAKTSIYDTANDKTLEFHWGNLPLNATDWVNNNLPVDISKYQEWSIGLQLMFQF